MSTAGKASLLRQPYPQENYTPEAIGFGLGIAVGLGGILYEGYEWVVHSKVGLPLAGFISTFAISTFGFIRARQHHHSQQSHLKDRQIDIESHPGSGLTKISHAIDELMKSFQLEMEASSETEEARILRQLKCLEHYQESKAAELTQAFDRVKQLQSKIEELSIGIETQKTLIEQLKSQKAVELMRSSSLIEEKEQGYLKEIKKLKGELERTKEALSIEKEAVEDGDIRLAFFQNQIAQLKDTIQEISRAGLKSPSANDSFDGLLISISNLESQSRESSRSSSRSSSASNSPLRLPSSPSTPSRRKSLFLPPLSLERSGHNE